MMIMIYFLHNNGTKYYQNVEKLMVYQYGLKDKHPKTKNIYFPIYINFIYYISKRKFYKIDLCVGFDHLREVQKLNILSVRKLVHLL